MKPKKSEAITLLLQRTAKSARPLKSPLEMKGDKMKKLLLRAIIIPFMFLFIFSSVEGWAEESSTKDSIMYKSIFSTPEDQLEFVKSGRLVLTKEDRSNPIEPKYHSTYHNVKCVLESELFFKKKVYTGENTKQIEVEYQAIYLSVPLQGFFPWSSAIHTSPPAGHYTMNNPDQVMGTEAWVLGIIVKNGTGVTYPDFVPRQSPWFRLRDTKLYKKPSQLNSNPVGAIISSIIPSKEFLNNEMKKYWVEADGRDVEQDWAYAKLPSKPTKIPDLRGMFLRGRNKFSDFKGERTDKWSDPGKRNNDGYQDEQIKNHNHRVPFRSQQAGHEGRGRIAAMTSYGVIWYNHASCEMAAGGKETRPKNIAVYYYIRIN